MADRLADLPAADEAAARTTRQFAIMGAINGRPMDMGRIDEVVPVGQSEVTWSITNRDPQPHNFHARRIVPGPVGRRCATGPDQAGQGHHAAPSPNVRSRCGPVT